MIDTLSSKTFPNEDAAFFFQFACSETTWPRVEWVRSLAQASESEFARKMCLEMLNGRSLTDAFVIAAASVNDDAPAVMALIGAFKGLLSTRYEDDERPAQIVALLFAMPPSWRSDAFSSMSDEARKAPESRLFDRLLLTCMAVMARRGVAGEES